MGLSYQVELKVHKMLHQGFGREEICKRLGVSDHFVRKELDKIRDEGRQGNENRNESKTKVEANSIISFDISDVDRTASSKHQSSD